MNQPGQVARCHERGETRIRWASRPDGLEESTQFTPGYNCSDRSMQGHGVHGMEITWLLRGPLGAIQIIFGTDWIPGELSPGHGLSPDGTRGWRRHGSHLWSTDPTAFGLGVHSRKPQYPRHESQKCGLLAGACFYNERLSGADKLVGPFLAYGEEVIWNMLEAAYALLAREEAADEQG